MNDTHHPHYRLVCWLNRIQAAGVLAFITGVVAGIGLLIYSLLTGSVFAQNLADSGGILLFLWKAAVCGVIVMTAADCIRSFLPGYRLSPMTFFNALWLTGLAGFMTAVSVLPKPPDTFDRLAVVRGIDMQIREVEADSERVAYLCSVRSQWAEGMGRGWAGQMQPEPAACRK